MAARGYAWTGSIVAVVAGMLALTALFTVSAVYSRLALDSTARALSVATNGAPSVRLLNHARTELRNIRRAAEEAAVAGHAGAARELRDASNHLHSALAAELQTPEYPTERAAAHRVLGTLGKLDHALTLLAPLDGDRAKANASYDDFVHLANDLDGALDELHQVNASSMQDDASMILSQQRSALGRILTVDLVCIGIALAVTVFVTRLLRAQLDVIQRRATELEYFAVQVGHDVLNPLLPIQLALDLCRMQSNDDRVVRAVDRAVRGVERLRRAANGLLAFARAGDPPASGEITSLNAAIELAAESSAAPERITIEPSPDAIVSANPAALDAVLRSFLHECERESPDEAPIGIRVHATEKRARVELSVRPGGKRPPAAQLFAPRIGGAGYPGIDLELEAARRIVEAHRGTLGLREEAELRVLWFELPTAALPRAVLRDHAT